MAVNPSDNVDKGGVRTHNERERVRPLADAIEFWR